MLVDKNVNWRPLYTLKDNAATCVAFDWNMSLNVSNQPTNQRIKVSHIHIDQYVVVLHGLYMFVCIYSLFMASCICADDYINFSKLHQNFLFKNSIFSHSTPSATLIFLLVSLETSKISTFWSVMSNISYVNSSILLAVIIVKLFLIIKKKIKMSFRVLT